MRLADITRLRRAEVFVTLGGVPWMRGVSVLRRPAIVLLLSAMTLSVRFAKINLVFSIVCDILGRDRRCYFVVINNKRGGGRPAPSGQIALAAMFTVSASNAVLKKNETTPWAITVRRIGCDATATSDTWQVMPTTKEK